ncbi:MAG: alpha/beta fold hydrolase [Longimicrobiales bacterium]|nr:alpha/beta fold hydrolase [Longimicrobiales bacterium]
MPHGHLETALRNPAGNPRGGAVLCHPHPVQGGTMHTKAVYTAARALNEVGLRTLRFNFRGVGCSTGTYDDGIGEEEDVRAALDWLELGLRDRPLIVGGLSFGSMVGLNVGVDDPRVVALVALGTPIHVYDYSYLARTKKPVLVIQGEHDEFGSAREVGDVLGRLGAHVTVLGVPGAGHLFEGHLEALQELIREYFSRGAGAEALDSGSEKTGGRPA